MADNQPVGSLMTALSPPPGPQAVPEFIVLSKRVALCVPPLPSYPSPLFRSVSNLFYLIYESPDAISSSPFIKKNGALSLPFPPKGRPICQGRRKRDRDGRAGHCVQPPTQTTHTNTQRETKTHTHTEGDTNPHTHTRTHTEHP